MTHQANPRRYILSFQHLARFTIILVLFVSADTSLTLYQAYAQPTPPTSSESQDDSVKDPPSSTADQPENDQSVLQDSSIITTKKRRSLDQIITRLAIRAVEKLRPDVRNGLIRIAVPTTRGVIQDRPSREVLAATLAHQVAQQPNVFVVGSSYTVDVLRNFDGLSLPLTIERSISLGQHLGVRYMFITELSPGSSTKTITLKARMISIKRRGVVYEEQVEITHTDYQRLRKYAVFDESKLEATWRSAILPGWGQLYQGRLGEATAYMSLTVGLVVGALWAQHRGQEAADQYRENTPNTVNYRFEANHHFARARVMWGALGVTWLSATLSAYLQGEDQARVQLNFDPARGGLNISGAF